MYIYIMDRYDYLVCEEFNMGTNWAGEGRKKMRQKERKEREKEAGDAPKW